MACYLLFQGPVLWPISHGYHGNLIMGACTTGGVVKVELNEMRNHARHTRPHRAVGVAGGVMHCVRYCVDDAVSISSTLPHFSYIPEGCVLSNSVVQTLDALGRENH